MSIPIQSMLTCTEGAQQADDGVRRQIQRGRQGRHLLHAEEELEHWSKPQRSVAALLRETHCRTARR
jgi:hypothetical protein